MRDPETPSLRTRMSPLPGDVQWFPAEIRRLIVAIKKQEGVYNPRHENFGLREFHSKAWKQVATEVGGGKTDIQCRDKWNCLRGTYRRHVRTEVTNNVKRRSGWPWAEMLSFIRPYVLDKDEYPREVKSPPKSESPKTQTSCAPSLTPITLKPPNSNMNILTGAPGLTFAGGIMNGGLILTQNRMGGLNLVQPNQLQGNVILQPNQTMGILQPNQINLVRPNQPTVAIMNPAQQNVTMGVVQPKLIAVSSGSSVNIVAKPIQTKATNSSTVTSSQEPKPPSPIEIDLSKVKPDPDAPPKSPERTEFVDMDISVKREPMEEEIQLPDFLSEDISQDSTKSGPIIENTKSVEESNNKSSPNTNQEEVETDSDSNQLFMKSILAHMNQLSPYDQSMFKMKVQQLLHEMMFPAESRKSATQR